MPPTLSVLISTINERLADVPGVLLPPDERVCYVVLWQVTHKPTQASLNTLPQLQREDVKLIARDYAGLSISRNELLNACTTRYALLCDDDVRFRPDAFNIILRAFKENTNSDILCFQATDYNGQPLKNYPTKPTEYARWPRGYAASSVEIALRLRYDTPFFDLRFGLGSKELVCGEEDIFLYQSAALGHRILFVPETILSTNNNTTDTRLQRHPKFLRSKGAALRLIHGRRGAWLRSIKYALLAPWGEKTWKLRLLAQGIRYIQRTPHPERPISVVIPYYNRAKTLPRLLESLLAVDYNALEIVLVDNGSTDNSLKICEDFRNKYSSRFMNVAILSEPEHSAAAARNRGLHATHGQYIYFFDSDDEISPTFFREAQPYLGRYDMICARTRMVFPSGKTKARRRIVPTTVPAQILGSVISTQTCLIRRTLFALPPTNTFWNTNLTRGDDLELGVRLVMTARSVKWLNTIHHRIYRHEESITGGTLWDDRQALVTEIIAIDTDILLYKGLSEQKELEPAWNALAARCMLILRKMEQEHGPLPNEDESIAFLRKQSRHATKPFQSKARVLCKHWPKHLPGLWRALLAIV